MAGGSWMKVNRLDIKVSILLDMECALQMKVGKF